MLPDTALPDAPMLAKMKWREKREETKHTPQHRRHYSPSNCFTHAHAPFQYLSHLACAPCPSLAPSLIHGCILCTIRVQWSLKMMVPGVSLSWSEGYKPGYVAVCSQRSKRAACDNNVWRGNSMQMTTRSKMWLLGACCFICRCRGGGKWSRNFHDLSACPGGLCCALTLLANADLKADITLLHNIICKQKILLV